MTTTVEAIYEAGVLRLLEPVELPEGAQVKVTVVANGVKLLDGPKTDPRTPAQIMAEIAALSISHGEVETSSRDHDHILYGEKGAR